MAIHNLTNIIKDASLIGVFDNQSEQWHQVRSTGVGGSDVGIICGLSEWQSPYTWAAKRMGLIPNDHEPSEAMEWGTALEDVIVEQWQKRNPEMIVLHDVGTWRNNQFDWQIANPDRIFSPDGGKTWGVLEIKTARYEDNWKHGADGEPDKIPAAYRAQVLWYMQTLGLEFAKVVVLFSGAKLQTYDVENDWFEADTNRMVVRDFLNEYITPASMPPFSAPFTSTLETVRAQNPDIEDSQIELGQIGRQYLDDLTDFNQAQADLDESKSAVLMAMGNAKVGLLEGVPIVSRQSRAGGTPYLVNKKF